MNTLGNKPWSMTPCRCGHPACKQYTIGPQGSVGFDSDVARAIVQVPPMVAAVEELLAAYHMEEDIPEHNHEMRLDAAIAAFEPILAAIFPTRNQTDG